VTGLAGEHGGRVRRVEGIMIQEPERSLSRTESGPFLADVDCASRSFPNCTYFFSNMNDTRWSFLERRDHCIGNRKETYGPTNKRERILPLRGMKPENDRDRGEKGGTGGGYGA